MPVSIQLVGQLEQQPNALVLLLQCPVDLDRELYEQLENDYARSQDFPEVLRGNSTVDYLLSIPFPYIDSFKVGHPSRILSDFVQGLF
jgi:hypothetical protein